MTDDPNLHPVWAKHFGTESKVKPQFPTPATVAEALARPVTVRTSTRTIAAREETLSREQIEAIFDDAGWIPASAERPAYGAAVTVKKQLSRHTWITTLVLPGDSRYPAEFITAPRESDGPQHTPVRTHFTQGETK